HARGIILRASRSAPARHEGCAFHVAVHERHDVGDAEYIGIDDNRASFITHELGRHETQDREGLEIVVLPLALETAAQIRAPLMSREKWIIARMDQLDVECIRVGGEALEGIFRNERTDDLLL